MKTAIVKGNFRAEISGHGLPYKKQDCQHTRQHCQHSDVGPCIFLHFEITFQGVHFLRTENEWMLISQGCQQERLCDRSFNFITNRRNFSKRVTKLMSLDSNTKQKPPVAYN